LSALDTLAADRNFKRPSGSRLPDLDIEHSLQPSRPAHRHMPWTASTYLHALEAAGILQEKQIGLNKLFLNSRFLKLLTQEPNEYKRFGSR
jgi:hypothetical protein